MKFVNDGFFNEEVGNYLEEALNNKESIIIAGHRSAGTRPFMANMMAVTKKMYQAVQVKKAEDLEKEAEYFLIPGIPNIDFEDLIYQAIKTDANLVTIKEPEQPLSLMKIFKKLSKEGSPTTKKFVQVECDKKNDVPFATKIVKFSQNEAGKVVKEEFDFEPTVK